MGDVEPSIARRLWWEMEPVNAVTYFAPECRQATTDIGLRGFWMGYFANRAAPLGPVAPAAVESTFFNFHPAMVRRAIPDAWGLADPATVLAARGAAASAAIERLAPDHGEVLDEVLPLLIGAVERGSAAGRPLFAANRDLLSDGRDTAALWQMVTTLREHRGDGHVAVLTESGLDGCEALALFVSTEGVPGEVMRAARGWDEPEWGAAVDRLSGRGLIGTGGEATAAGLELRARIERRTDELAIAPYEDLGEDAVGGLLGDLRRVARPIAASGEIAYPNPMGLPAPSPAA